MKRGIISVILFGLFLSMHLSAQSDVFDIYQYTPKVNSSYINAPEGFSIQIITYKNAINYNIFNNIRGRTDVIAWKSTPQNVFLVTRLRGWNQENEASYYLIQVNEESKAKVQKIDGIPKLDMDYYFCKAKTNDNAINVRDKGDLDGKKIGQYSINNEVSFSGLLLNKCLIEDAIDYWYSFNYNGEIAWIYGKYLTFDYSALINEETLRLKKSNIEYSKNTVLKDISKLNIEVSVTNGKNPNPKVYDIYQNGDTQLSVENNGVSLYSNSRIIITKESKTLSNIECRSGQYAYIPDSNRLYYVTYSSGDNNLLNCIDCSNGSSILLRNIHNQRLNIYTSNIDMNSSRTNLLFASQIYTKEWDDVPMLAINLLSIKDNSITTIPLNVKPNLQYFNFGFITNEIIYIRGLSETTNEIEFYRLSGHSLVPISKGVIEYGMDFTNYGYEDWFNYYKAPGITYVLISLDPEYTGSNKSLVLGLENNVFKDFSSKINGFIINTFHYNGQWYIGTISYTDKSNTIGTIYIYDQSFHIVKQDMVKCNEFSWGTIISKIGIKDNKIIVVFSQMSK
jgi:hypothetical protein